MGPTAKTVQLGEEEPEADQSSVLGRRILAVLEQHHQETLQRLDKLAAGTRLSYSSGDANPDLAPDGADPDTYLDGSAKMGDTKSPTSPPGNDVLGHGDGMSPDEDRKGQELFTHPGDGIPSHDSLPLWPSDLLPQSDTATGTRVTWPTRKIVELGAEEPETEEPEAEEAGADQSSVVCQPDAHPDGSAETGKHIGFLKTSTSQVSQVNNIDSGRSNGVCLTSPTEKFDPEDLGPDQSSVFWRSDMNRVGSIEEMGNDSFGMHMGLTETPMTPPDKDVPGHYDGMSPKGRRASKCYAQNSHSRRSSRDHGQGRRSSRDQGQPRKTSKDYGQGDGGDSEDSDDRRHRLSALLEPPSVGISSTQSEAVIPVGSWRHRLRKMLHSTVSEVCIVIAILVNSLLIGAEVQYEADYPYAPTMVFIYLNIAFTVLFLAELLARTWVDGLRRFWCSKDWAWNLFDLIIVTTSLAEVLMAAWASDVSTPTIMRVFRIARVGKALRIQRLIRFISALRTLVYSIFVTLRSLVWALILLLIIMYIFGVVIAQFCVEHLYHGTDMNNQRLMKFWGSLWASMLTLFQSITGGISWYEVTDPLHEVSGVLVGVFIMYIFLITFAVFNVITGIFCHSAIETAVRDPDLAAQAELQSKKLYIQRVRKLFHEVDEDGSGVICLQELESVVKDENVRAYFAALDLDLSDAWTIFKLIAGKSDVIDQDTFVQGCLRLRGSARRQDCIATLTEMEALLRKFSSFAKITTQKMERLSAPGGLLQPQKPETPLTC